ncbi:MAG: GDP-fucose synthetase [Candidatus Woykebacteria bacterium GWB1_45_5]|uniref:GDP-L-fucose synthase n=1 Tax=Candidatus Woykebacteria bacterium GWB1_45_5 TaxID=1802592 RepID=A0A1G1W9U0_9BACT|nr:MAG: GDP-fucose synthetase [Candidatus Woykebacteria bacterium GWB1_45_5]
MNIDLKSKKILVTGGSGFLGSHVVLKLIESGVSRENISVPRSKEVDLRKYEDCEKVLKGQNLVIHLAAKVGGIGFNQEKPGELFYDNIVMGARMIDAACRAGVEKMLILGTVCAYPKFTPAPFMEKNLWNGYPEETNAPYGLAKKALLTQSQAYRAEYGFNSIFLLPVNLYGPRDSFDPEKSHVIPALIKKVADAKEKNTPFVELWGTGKATREFLFVEDAAEGIVKALESYEKPDPVNLGSGKEISIQDLISLICRLMDFKGELRWDPSRPDGQPRRLLDVSKAEQEFGFKAKTGFEEGLRQTIDWYLKEN